jgi:hypothetical protein
VPGIFQLQVFGPPANIAVSPYPIWVVAGDPDSQLIDLQCDYNFNGQGYETATLTSTSDRPTGVAAPQVGADYRLIWDAVTDLGMEQDGTATFRVTAMKAGATVGSAETAAFTINTHANSLPPINGAPGYVDPVPLPLSLTALNPTSVSLGISGQLLPDRFMVAASLGGVRISFCVVSDPGASNPLAEIDDEGISLATTDRSSGSVSVAVRALPGASGTGKVQARIVGVPDNLPGALVEFPIQVSPAVITANCPTQVVYGQEFPLDVGRGPKQINPD